MKGIVKFIILSMCVTVVGCSNDPEILTSGNGAKYITFDFSSTFDCPVSFNIPGRSFVTLYKENPADNPQAEAIRTAWTSADGHFNCTLTLPKHMIGSQLYAQVGDRVITTDVTPKGANFSLTGAKSRATADLQPTVELCQTLKDDYLSVMPRGDNQHFNDNRQKLKETGEIALETSSDNTQILFTFLNTYGWNSNFVFYYYYQGQDPVTEENRAEYVRKFCANDKFMCTRGWGVDITNPGLNPELDGINNITTGGKGWLNLRFEPMIGTSNYLYFYGENYDQEPTTYFPKDYKIGFILMSVNYTERHNIGTEGYDIPQDKVNVLFSNPTVNHADYYGNRVHACRYLTMNEDNDVSRLVYGFEDSTIGKDVGADYNYTDFLFMVSTTPTIMSDDLQRFGDTQSSVSGTLLFEDLFPIQGDYDMNDVISEYHKVKNFEIRGDEEYIKDIYVDLTPVHYGATYDDYLYVQCFDKSGNVLCDPILADFVTGLGSRLQNIAIYNENELTTSSSPHLKTLRVYLMKDYMIGGKEMRNLKDDDVPFDKIEPFLYVKGSNREVHVTGYTSSGKVGLPNTDLADTNLQQYRAKESRLGFFPWALDLPIKSNGALSRGFIPVTEGVNINFEYLTFGQWVESGGKDYTNWFYNEHYSKYRAQ